MCDLLMRRKMFQVKKASRQVHEDHKARIVYVIGDQVKSMTLEAYRAIGLDDLGATRVCVIGNIGMKNHFQRYRYARATDKFKKI